MRLLNARCIDPSGDGLFVVVFELMFVGQVPRVAVQNVARDSDSERDDEPPEHAPSELAANARVHKVDKDAEQANECNEANQIRNNIKHVSCRRTSLLANSLRFVIPHWIDEHESDAIRMEATVWWHNGSRHRAGSDDLPFEKHRKSGFGARHCAAIYSVLV